MINERNYECEWFEDEQKSRNVYILVNDWL